MGKKDILAGAMSDYESYCDGFFGSNASCHKNYITGVILNIGVVKKKYSHEGSILLDSILAFDQAEVASTNMGQINMITVSSFCGPAGLIWGYDIARHPDIGKNKYLLGAVGGKIPVYSAEPLKQAMFKLFGNINDKRFPLLPGAHVPCAGKHISIDGPRHIYAALAFGISKNREKDACLFMEDVGFINGDTGQYKKELKEKILSNMANSVIQIGKNQKIEYKEIFVDMVDTVIKPNEVGCALVAAPYFTLAQKAVPGNDLNSLATCDINKWEKLTKSGFLSKVKKKNVR